MKLITEHIGEIIIALSIFALLTIAVMLLKDPMTNFFTGIAEKVLITDPAAP